MELLEIVIITIVFTLLVITLGNIKKQNDQIIIFMIMLAGLMIINLCFVKKQENFQVENLTTLEKEKKLFNNRYKDPKFEEFIDPRNDIKNYNELLNPTSQKVFSTEVVKLR